MSRLNIFLNVMMLILVGCSTPSQKSQDPISRKAEIFYIQGTNDLIQKRYTSALKNLLKSHKLNPKDSKTATNLGMAYFFKNRSQLAIKNLNLALKLDNTNENARNNLAGIYYKLGQYTKSEELYEKILENLTYEHQYRIYYNLALIELKKNNIKKADHYLKQSLSIKDDYCPAHFQLGKSALNRKLYKKAYKSFLYASKGTCYQDPAAHYYQGVTLTHLRKYKKADGKFKHIVNNYPDTEFSKLSFNYLNYLEDKISIGQAAIKRNPNNGTSNTFTKSPKKDKQNTYQSNEFELPPGL